MRDTMTASQNDAITQVADDLRAAYSKGAIAPIRDRLPENDLAAAYAVQNRNTEYWLKQGRRLIGRKIGLTSRVVQQQFGVDQPDYGMLFADMAYGDAEEVPFDRLLQPKVEGEIALVLGRDVTEEQPTVPDMLAAIDYALPAIEIVDSRIADWKIGIVDTIADNGSSAAFVLGSRKTKLEKIDLWLCGMVLEHRGEPLSTGAGASCLGNPLNAARWLAGTMVRAGRPLRAGDVLMTGSLGPMVPAAAGGVYEVRISGLGAVRAVFSRWNGSKRA